MVSKLQGVLSKATVGDLKEANQALHAAKEDSHVGIIFHSDAISWDSDIVVTVTNASFAQEVIIEPN